MSDGMFEDPRPAALYDPLDPDRGDLDAYLELADRLEANRVLDICGTGVFALLPAARGIEVVGLDPAGPPSTSPGASRAVSGFGGFTATSRRCRRSRSISPP